MMLEDKLMVALCQYAFSPTYCFSTDGRIFVKFRCEYGTTAKFDHVYEI
jgi:hypothetical protein